MSFEEQVLQEIRSAMPSHAQFHEVNSVYSYYLFASWKINDRPDRPERMSKAIAVCLALLICGHWMISEIVSFTTALFDKIPTLIGGG